MGRLRFPRWGIVRLFVHPGAGQLVPRVFPGESYPPRLGRGPPTFLLGIRGRRSLRGPRWRRCRLRNSRRGDSTERRGSCVPVAIVEEGQKR